MQHTTVDQDDRGRMVVTQHQKKSPIHCPMQRLHIHDRPMLRRSQHESDLDESQTLSRRVADNEQQKREKGKQREFVEGSSRDHEMLPSSLVRRREFTQRGPNDPREPIKPLTVLRNPLVINATNDQQIRA